MRINAFLARATGLSRRSADAAIAAGKVTINGQPASPGQQITPSDNVLLAGMQVKFHTSTKTILLHKPTGYVCSRNGQGSSTIYELLPDELAVLKPVGRLDKDSSGLLLLTNDGQLAHELTHPKFAKEKIYHVTLNKQLTAEDTKRVMEGIRLDDGVSKLTVTYLQETTYEIRMHEGRNRQIRRTFEALGYMVTGLHRTTFGSYELGNLQSGTYIDASPEVD